MQLTGEGEKELREDQHRGDAVHEEVEVLGGAADDHAHSDFVGSHGGMTLALNRGRIGMGHVVRSCSTVVIGALIYVNAHLGL